MRYLPAILPVLAMTVAGCGSESGPAPPPRPLSALVVTANAVARDVPVEIRVIGNVEPVSTVAVRSQAAGPLVKVNFREGQTVGRGDTLFLIDSRPFDEAIRQVEANLARDAAYLRQAEANLQRDLAQEKFAREQADRYQALSQQGILSRQQADQYLTEASVRAEAVVADRAAIESARAAIRADEAALANARLERSYCTIVSPIAGRTGDVLVREGNLVKINDTELVRIHQVRPIQVAFSVPEKDLPQIRKHMAAGRLKVAASAPGGGGTEDGWLDFIDNEVDRTTGTVRLKGTFPNPGGSLWPGQFVNVALRLSTKTNAVVVPSRALQTGQAGEFVYVVTADMTAEARPVTAGIRLGEEVEVETGLQAGETVVTEGHLRLTPGMKVRLRSPS